MPPPSPSRGLTEPGSSMRSRVDPKPPPVLSPEQFDLWGAFAASWEQGEAVEAAPPRQAKNRPASEPTHGLAFLV
jgi:hypothetical protein